MRSLAAFFFLAVYSTTSFAVVNSGFVNEKSTAGQCYSTRATACVAYPVPSGDYTMAYTNSQCVMTRTSTGGTTIIGTTACNKDCPAGQVLGTTGACECPAGTELYNGACVTPCASDQTRNTTTGQCEGPCTPSQASAAAAQNAASQDKVTVTNTPIGPGLIKVNESTTVAYTCINTCKVKVSTYVRVGTITSTSYQWKDWSHWEAPSGGCANMPSPVTTTTSINIGQKPEGGCRDGFAFGEVNGVAGCYGAPSSGAASGTGGGGPQNNPGNPGGSDGAGNNTDGTNQNGPGGACNAGFHDLNGTCVRDSVGGGGDGGGEQGGSSDLPDHTSHDADDFSEAVSDFKAGVDDAPIVQAFSGMSSLFSSSSGTCPTPGFDIFGQHFVIDMHCTLYANISGILGALMMVIWTFIGLRVIASA